ncbi:MAG: M20 family metallopeptidase [Terracidiphilus sp.]
MTLPPVPDLDVANVAKEACRHEEKLIDRLRTLVEIESPSSDKAGVDHVQSVFSEWAEGAGGIVRRHTQRGLGDSLEVGFGGRHRSESRTMLLGHLDTVWARGTLARMPFRVSRDRISGPGVLDMKAGVVMSLTAIEVLQQMKLLRRPVTLLIHGDEEVGSPASRMLTETVARRCSAVYVMEPAQGDAGAYKTARKAVGLYRLSVKGVAAHSGVDFEQGHSAVIELARQIEVLQSLTDLSSGITVNPGVIGGGTCSNVIPAEAWVEIDVRVARSQDTAKVDRMLRSLRPFDKACKLAISGGMNRPPMERSKGTVALFLRARQLAATIGIALEEAATGGASDGNFTAALGIPTLDGMGAVGAGAHAPHEHLRRKHLAPRTALLAAMLM